MLFAADSPPPTARPDSSAPYAEALAAFARRSPRRCTVPGHKGGAAAPPAPGLSSALFDLDVPTLLDGIDVVAGDGPAPLEQAEQLAAQAWGARRTFFLTNGASQGNHAACLAVARAGRPVVVQRSAHGSTFDGLVLSGLEARFVAPEIDAGLGIALGVTPQALDAALARTPGASAAFVVSPTYHGAVADVRGLAEVAHRHGAALVVDEAWGAHLAFSDLLPEDALSAGADLVISSTHKHLGSLTGSAMLHLAHGAPSWLDEAGIAASLRLVGTTSPSSLKRASLDAARCRAQRDGATLLESAIADLTRLRWAIRDVPGLDVMDGLSAGRPGMAGHDPLRLCVDVSRSGATGWEIAAAMRRDTDVHVELCEERVIVAVFGLGEPIAPIGAALLMGLRRAVRHLAGVGDATAAERPRDAIAIPGADADPPAVSLRAAALGPGVAVPADRAAGCIAAEALTPYPPGIPVVLPGERLRPATITVLRHLVAAGGTLRGAADPALETVRILAG